MDKSVTVYAELDPDLSAEFKDTLKREGRTMKAVVERALRDYINRSKAEQRAARQAERERSAA